MSVYKLELTETEVACGVTLEKVQEVLPKVLVRNGRVILPEFTPPALCGAVARCVFAGSAEFSGLNSLGMPVYREER